MINIHTNTSPRPPGGIPQQQTITRAGGRSTVYSYWAFQEGSDALAVVQEALALIEDRMTEGVINSCDTAFRAIRGVSFSDLYWSDEKVVTIFRSPTAARRNECALTQGQGLARHFTLTPACFNVTVAEGRDRVVRRCAATIVHELAHCAGAGGRPSRTAEDTLLVCGFRDEYNPLNVG